MRLLIHILQLALYSLSILGSLYLFSLNAYLNSLRSELPMLAEWKVTPSWSILVLTSPAFIWGSPLIPILGVIAAWKLRNHSKQAISILAVSALLAVILVFFTLYNEPLEGHLVCC
jgi:4-amino-4-deoxy-L-arabinose transferase-like glycosyltransferase